MSMQSVPDALDMSAPANAATRTFPSRFTSVPDVANFVEAFCAAQDVRREDRLRLNLILEELLSNTIVHGHGGERDSPVTVSLAVTPIVIMLRYEDLAPGFDVAAALANAKDGVDADFDERPVGHLGLHLLAHYAADVRYVRDNGRNRVTLTLQRSA
jgi:serine/threonine-protein kinase RsbW